MQYDDGTKRRDNFSIKFIIYLMKKSHFFYFFKQFQQTAESYFIFFSKSLYILIPKYLSFLISTILSLLIIRIYLKSKIVLLFFKVVLIARVWLKLYTLFYILCSLIPFLHLLFSSPQVHYLFRLKYISPNKNISSENIIFICINLIF